MNYQLARTNILLSGQLKWDIIIGRKNGSLVVEDFHITPISPNVPFNKYSEENLLNYSHQENVRSFFSKIEGNFWQNLEDPQLKHTWPIISNNTQDTHCGIFEMGCRRDSYQLYGKQFYFLCPVWLESLNENESLQFTLEIKGASKYNNSEWVDCPVFGSRTIDINKCGDPYHDKFVDYFHNYLKYIQLNETGSDLVEINFNQKTAWITGLEVSSGNMITKSVNTVCENLLYRERPLMETDSLIINLFPENKLISKQLFNICIHFNLEDILDARLLDMMKGKDVSVSCFASIQDMNDNSDPKLLEIKDFYSNYEYIPRKLIDLESIPELTKITSLNLQDTITGSVSTYTGTIPNVLSYLKDFNYIQTIDKNRFVQNIIHWTLQGNSDYIFNIYNGFGGFINRNNNPISLAHVYGDSPNLLKSTNTINNSDGSNITEPTNLGWCTTINCTWKSLQKILRMGGTKTWLDENGEQLVETNAPNFIIYDHAADFTQIWVKNVKYSQLISDKFDKNNINNLKVILIKLPSDIDIENLQQTDPIERLKYLSPTKQEIEWTQTGGPQGEFDKLYWATDPNGINMIYLISNDFNNLTFRHVLTTLNNQIMSTAFDNNSNPNNYFSGSLMSEFREVLRNVISTPIISFTKSLTPYIADSPSYSTNEIDYYKDDQASASDCFVIRYDGKISPAFISINDKKNYLYFKDIISDDRSNGRSQLQKSIWAQYMKSKMLPLYPSIGYCAIKSSILDYNHPNIVRFTLSNNDIPINTNYEYSWFNNGKSLVLIPEITTELKSTIYDDGTFMKLDDLILNWIISFYDIEENQAKYIMKLYNISSSFDYDYSGVTEDDPQWFLNHYIYKVKLILK